MVYVGGLSGFGIVVVSDAVRSIEQALAASLTLQVPADASDARLQTVVALVRQTAGVKAVHLFDRKETERLLEPWLGAAAPLDELPVPRLIDVTVDPSQSLDIAALRRQLASVVPEATLDDHRAGVPGARAAAHRIEAILGVLIAIAMGLIAVSAVFATRAAMTMQAWVVELLHLLGTDDAAIARYFALRSLSFGLLGGAVGSATAVLTVLALGGADALVQLAGPVSVGLSDWRLWAVMVGVAIIAGAVAMASAHITTQRRLVRLP
ncbi:MAG TPA: hypothetical protein VHW90_10285 [Stellaceae bacterium]|nr:hypothetical protein [Stellaceae bacterium]